MAFDYDETNPLNDAQVSAYPANERAHRVATKGAIDVEHAATEGRHKFGRGATGARDAISTWVVGSVWINTSRITGEEVLDICDSIGPVTWVETAFGITDIAQVWTGGNSEAYTALDENAGGPGNTWDWIVDSGTAWKGTLSDATILNNPTGPITIAADRRMSAVVQVTQHGATPFAVTFGTNLLPAWGSQPAVNQTLSSITLIHFTLRSDQKWIYSVEYTS